MTGEYLYASNTAFATELNLTNAYSTALRANLYAGSRLLGEDAADPDLTNSATATMLRIADQVPRSFCRKHPITLRLR